MELGTQPEVLARIRATRAQLTAQLCAIAQVEYIWATCAREAAVQRKQLAIAAFSYINWNRIDYFLLHEVTIVSL